MTRSDYDIALAALYAAFDTPKPRRIEGCPCCIDTRNIDVLLSKPLGTLTSGDLSRYASGAFLTVGGPVDYRYLLPRILELSANDVSWWPSPEIVIGALSRAAWRTWTGGERDAVLDFLSAWFDRWASGSAYEDGYQEIESLLCGMARAGVDITPYLQRLLRPENARGLTELWKLHGAAKTGSPAESFWEDAPESWRRLTDFLASDAVRRSPSLATS